MKSATTPIHLEVGKRYRVKIGQYPRYANWRYGEITSETKHGEYTKSYFFKESVMNSKYPKKEYYGSYIWASSYPQSEHSILQAEEIILFDTVKYLYSIAPKTSICVRLNG